MLIHLIENATDYTNFHLLSIKLSKNSQNNRTPAIPGSGICVNLWQYYLQKILVCKFTCNGM